MVQTSKTEIIPEEKYRASFANTVPEFSQMNVFGVFTRTVLICKFESLFRQAVVGRVRVWIQKLNGKKLHFQKIFLLNSPFNKLHGSGLMSTRIKNVN